MAQLVRFFWMSSKILAETNIFRALCIIQSYQQLNKKWKRQVKYDSELAVFYRNRRAHSEWSRSVLMGSGVLQHQCSNSHPTQLHCGEQLRKHLEKCWCDTLVRSVGKYTLATGLWESCKSPDSSAEGLPWIWCCCKWGRRHSRPLCPKTCRRATPSLWKGFPVRTQEVKNFVLSDGLNLEAVLQCREWTKGKKMAEKGAS